MGHQRPVNHRCPPVGHPRFTGCWCPSVKFPGLKVKISTFAAVSPSGSSSWLILRHLRLICSTYLVFGEVWTTAKSKNNPEIKLCARHLKIQYGHWPISGNGWVTCHREPRNRTIGHPRFTGRRCPNLNLAKISLSLSRLKSTHVNLRRTKFGRACEKTRCHCRQALKMWWRLVDKNG